ncbi:MAG: MIP/aquaporin family protein [Candidatus Acidiferrales bacterium]
MATPKMPPIAAWEDPMYTMPQKLVAESIGTFTLTFIGAGSICANQFMGEDGGGILAIAAAHGLALAIAVTAVGHISGGHINPAVTIAFWVTKKMGTVEALLYWLAQIAGAIVAAYLLKGLLPADVWGPVSIGTPALAPDFTRAQGMILEGVLTFLLVFVVFATAVDERGAFGKIAGFAIGLTVAMDIYLGGPFTGAAMNPARALGPALASGFWANHGVYWVGPLAGGVVAGWLYDFVFLRKPTKG